MLQIVREVHVHDVVVGNVGIVTVLVKHDDAVSTDDDTLIIDQDGPIGVY